MTVIKLVHPVYGLICEKEDKGKYRKKAIIKSWRYTYGKKVDDCEIIIEKNNTLWQKTAV